MSRRGACVIGAVCAWVLCIALCPVTARAQSYHTLNLGGRAAGMGTAYTAIADDGSAAYYNPGGIGLGPTTRVAANVTLNSFERLKIDEQLRTATTSRGLTEKSDPTIPIFASVSTAFGKRDRWGVRPFSLTFSAFTLERFQFSGELRAQDDLGRTTTALYDRAYRAPYYGLSFSHRVRRDLGWGVSAFLTPRSLTHQETFDVPYGGEPSPSAPFFDGAGLINRNTRLTIDSYDLVFRFGVLKKLKRYWSLGLMAQPPGWRVRAQTELRFQFSAVESSEASPQATFVFFEESVKSSMPIPWELRGGVAYGPRGRVTLSMDVQLVGRVTQRDVLQAPSLEGLEDRIPPTGLFFDARGKRKMVGNVLLGADVQVAREVYIRTGFLTDFDPDPRLHETSEVYESPRVHRYGFSLNAAIHRKRRWLQAGLAALFGSGYASGIDVERGLAGEAPFFRTEARSRLFLLSITAANDFGSLAREGLEEKLKQRREERSEE
jgi:hypothetical protein